MLAILWPLLFLPVTYCYHNKLTICLRFFILSFGSCYIYLLNLSAFHLKAFYTCMFHARIITSYFDCYYHKHTLLAIEEQV